MQVAQVEEYLIRRAKETLDLAGMDIIVRDGTNADLGPAIATALRQSGGTPASPLAATDAEMATLDPALEPAFLLACRIEALETALDRLHARVDLMIGGGAGNSYSLHQAAQSLSRTIERLRAQYAAWYEAGSGRTELAPIDSDYHDPDSELLGSPYCS